MLQDLDNIYDGGAGAALEMYQDASAVAEIFSWQGLDDMRYNVSAAS